MRIMYQENINETNGKFFNYVIKYSIVLESVTQYLIFRDNKELRR